MAKTVKLVSDNGFGWRVGDSGEQVIELTTEHGYGWTASRGEPTPADVPPANTELPTITGTAQVGETLTASEGTWTGTPTPTYSYQWEADGVDIVGATDATYVLTAAEEGTVITVTVTATNSAGSASATSAGTEAVTAAA